MPFLKTATAAQAGTDRLMSPEDTEQCAVFMDLSLSLAGGLAEAKGLETLFKAASPWFQQKNAALQKRAYKILAYLCELREDFTSSVQRSEDIIIALEEGKKFGLLRRVINELMVPTSTHILLVR